jgi:CheY-like chemotaxis protein
LARTILVVDDDHELRTALADLLEIEGYHVVQTANGAEALEVLRQGLRPALVILDLMMPVMDGSQFLSEIGRDSALAGLRVVVMSASRRTDVGGYEFWPKPGPVEGLLAIIQRHCGADA